MLSSSSKLALILLLLSAGACSKLKRETVLRRPFPRLDPTLGSSVDPVEAEPVEELYSSVGKLSACEWLQQVGSGDSLVGRFRVIGKAQPVESSDQLSDDDNGPLDFLRFWDNDIVKESDACRRVRFGNRDPKWVDQCYQERALLAKRKGVNLNRISGRVDMAANPLYNYALTAVVNDLDDPVIPDGEGFLSRVEDTLSKSPTTIPTLIAYRALMKLNILDVYTERNKRTQRELNRIFPGAFNREIYHLQGSFPDTIFTNGSPALNTFTPLPDDSQEIKSRKIEGINAMLSIYSRDVSLFSHPSWDSFREDMRSGMTAAIRGLNSRSPIEQACGATLIHRSFAQLLTVKGYDRVPVTEDLATRQSSLPPLEELLEDKESRRFKVCKTTGSFVRNGYRHSLSLDDLNHLSSLGSELSLAATPYLPGPCEKPVSVVSPDYRDATGAFVGVDDPTPARRLLEFASGVSYFTMAFNPAAPWWKNGLPLGKWTTFESIVPSGAVLPMEANALSLAFLQASFGNIQDRHLVQIDENGRETSDASRTLGVRISESPRTAGTGGTVETTARSAALLAEFAFRFSAHLDKLADWYPKARAFSRDEDRRIREEYRQRLLSEKLAGSSDEMEDSQLRRKAAIDKDFKDQLKKNADVLNDFVSGMFGGEETLVRLTKEGSDGALRSRMQDLKLVASFLLVSFVKREADGRLTCYDHLTSDLDTGSESKTGECSDRDSNALGTTQSLFKQAMAMAAREYDSPIFKEFSK